MPGALKVQTAPGVWTVVGGQAPGLDQAGADARYVLKVGDIMTGPLQAPRVIVDAAPTATNHLVNKAFTDATYVNVAGDTMTGALLSQNSATFKAGVSIWQIANSASSLQFFNAATSETALGSRTGYVGINSGGTQMHVWNERGTSLYLTSGAATGSDVIFRTGGTTAVEVARITAGGTGCFLMGKTTASQTTKGIEFRKPGHLILNTGDTQMDTNLLCDKLAGTAVNGSPYARWLKASVIIGSITVASSTTAVLYNTTSHAPWKGNVTPLDGDAALAVIQQLRPVSYQWKLDADGMPTSQGTPSGEVAHGFIAQELFEVMPGAVTQGSGDEAEHDAWLVRRKAQEDALAVDPQAIFDEDIDPVVPWQIDQSRLIPELVAGVQALATQLGAVQSFNADLIAALQAVLNPADPATFSSLADLIPEA